MRVGVIDYGVGNMGSVMRALGELRVSPILVTRAIDLHGADRLILPGVGNFADCARRLVEGEWPQALRDVVLGDQKPLLGVCVGMQLLASCSMEGAGVEAPEGTMGLGFIPGRVEHLRTLGCSLRVPHVGWNAITISATKSSLFDGIPDGTDFYFVHSYAFVPADPADVLATTDYGVPMTATVNRGHIWGTQFHPEKSSRAGFRLLRNFIEGPTC
jgi:imidazole glycerol-phosphate synthase subunit HisH